MKTYGSNKPDADAASESAIEDRAEGGESGEGRHGYGRGVNDSSDGRIDGVVRGDDKEIADRGTERSRMVGSDAHIDGADLGPDAINRMAGFPSATRSDPVDQCYPDKAPKGNA
jgi:hypothetical protein